MDMNKIYNMDCLEGMKKLPNDSIDLTVTSPPYDKLRKYKGFSWDFKSVAKELYRITKPGGVVVWIVSDSTINGSETGTSFKQALFFKEIKHGQIAGISSTGFYNTAVRHSHGSHRGAVCHGGRQGLPVY